MLGRGVGVGAGTTDVGVGCCKRGGWVGFGGGCSVGFDLGAGVGWACTRWPLAVVVGTRSAAKTSVTTLGQERSGSSPVAWQTCTNLTPAGMVNSWAGWPFNAASMKACQMGAAV